MNNENIEKAAAAAPLDSYRDKVARVISAQDEAFATYITTMLDGVINNNKSRKEI